jgi:pimeloyl-ACP methyl ester carboxylesterase
MTTGGQSPPDSTLQHISRGCLSLLGMVLHPLGQFCGSLLSDLRTPTRLDKGLVLVLPGIEGESFLNHNIARGLADGGVESGIEIFDWTTGVILLFLYHLRGNRRHIRQAQRLVERIVAYRQSHPGRPVHLVGHSGGGAMIVLALERLPPENNVTCVILLQSALSPDHDLTTALERTERGIWNVRSALDVFFLGVGTWITGTLDGRHHAAAGMVGFRQPAGLTPTAQELYAKKLHDLAFRPAMIADFHVGGHLSVTSRPFLAKHVAPLLIAVETA